jgi:hypothetical protein
MRVRSSRHPRAARSTILGGLGLATAAIALLVLLLVLAWLQGAARMWPAPGWAALAGLAAVLLSLEVLFLRDYLGVRRARRPAAVRSRV